MITTAKVKSDDIPELPKELREDYYSSYARLLCADPYNLEGVIGSHDLDGKLANHRALEIDYYGIAYRLVYRIFDSPDLMRVDVISFAVHDVAYDRAKERIYKEAIRKW